MKPPWRGGDSWMGLSPFCTKHDSLEFSCCLRGAGTWLGTRLPGVAGRIELACAHDLVLSENKKYNGCICNHNASELHFEHQAVKIEWVKTCKHVKKDKKLESARIELATSPMLREHYTTKPWPQTAAPQMRCFIHHVACPIYILGCRSPFIYGLLIGALKLWWSLSSTTFIKRRPSSSFHFSFLTFTSLFSNMIF